MLPRGLGGPYTLAQTILYVVNEGGFFLSHRLPLAQAARDAGYRVAVAVPASPADSAIREAGFELHGVPLDRRSLNPLKALATLVALRRLYRRLRPDLVHHITIKPVILGSLAARLAGVRAVVNAVPGLGYVFVRKGPAGWLLRTAVRAAYRVALRGRNTVVIFQNPDDRDAFVRWGLVRRADTALIRGSGVDTEVFRPGPEPPPEEGPPVILLASRLLWDKGVGDFVAAARCLQADGIEARLAIAGEPDAGNPSSIAQEQLDAWVQSGAVEWWGRQDDMPAVYALTHIACLPSAYGEGVPKALIEAAACGRPIVTTDIPGCREIVRDGVNGLLVAPRDAEALAAALRRLIEDPALRTELGARGREVVVAEFSEEKVTGETLLVYDRLLAGARGSPAETRKQANDL